jgi:hypothetical protein
VSLFVLSPEMGDRDEVEAATGRSTKRPTLNNMYYFIFKRITKKSDMNSFIFFCCSYSKITIFKLTIFTVKAPIIPSSLVILLVPT